MGVAEAKYAAPKIKVAKDVFILMGGRIARYAG